MIAVTQEGKNVFLVQVQEPELTWLNELPVSLGMDRPVMLAACLTKGLEHYYNVIREIDEHDKEEPKPERPETTTYNKGPCQG